MLNRIRTMRKGWLIVAGVAAVLIFALLLGVVIAAKADHRSDRVARGEHYGYGYGHSRHGFGSHTGPFARIAGWFGFGQDRAERADARFTSYTGLLAANGTLTPAQADEANAWFLGRPPDTDGIAAAMAGAPNSQRTTATLARLVSAEKLTQQQAESIVSWNAQRPDFLAQLSKQRSEQFDEHRSGRRDSGHRK
ncbi:MAG: hypothetical protein OXE87_13240 [Chloroflexi bacterium]|nr:hypothetical protein [Chloroflexota bacterium]